MILPAVISYEYLCSESMEWLDNLIPIIEWQQLFVYKGHT